MTDPSDSSDTAPLIAPLLRMRDQVHGQPLQLDRLRPELERQLERALVDPAVLSDWVRQADEQSGSPCGRDWPEAPQRERQAATCGLQALDDDSLVALALCIPALLALAQSVRLSTATPWHLARLRWRLPRGGDHALPLFS